VNRPIFSKPTASAHSAIPAATALRATMSAVEPDAQALFTFTTGTPVWPSSYTARCPAVVSPKQ
jgi:hypothetical protein